MKKFLYKVLFFSIPILFLAISAEIILRSIPNDYLYKKEYLDKNSDFIETLILGSSHTFYGLDPKYFSRNTFNASHISQPLFYDFEILKKYEKKLNNLKTIIVPVSYFTFHFDLGLFGEPWRVKNYILYYGIVDASLKPIESFKYRSELFSIKFKKNAIRIISYLMGRKGISCSKLGWGEGFNSEDAVDLSISGITNSKRHHSDINKSESLSVFMKNKTILNLIVSWAIEKKVNVILLTPPAFKTYYCNLQQDQINIVIKTAEEIAQKNSNCSYYNTTVSFNL